MIAIRTKNLSPLFSDILGIRKYLEALPGVSLITSPGDGVDWELSGAIPEGTDVYTLVPKTKDYQDILDAHKLTLGVFDVIPLFHKDYLPSEIGEYGLYGVEDVDELVWAEEKLGGHPEIVRISVNPLEYPKELLDYCKENDIKILGTDIFGERLLREYYKDLFPESFLQAFGEHNTNLIEIPGEDPYLISRVYSRVGEEYEDRVLLEYSKTMNKVPSLKPPTGRIVHQRLEMTIGDLGNIVVPADRGEFTIKPIEEKFNLGDPLWEDDLIPEDMNQEDKDLLGVLHRYHVLPKLQELHSPRIWKPVFTRVYQDFWAIKLIPRSLFGWMWKEHYYLMISGKLWKIPLSEHENLTYE